MPTQAERVTALEVHYEHVDKTLTAISGTLDAVRADVADRFDRIEKAIADDRAERSETTLRIEKAIADDRVERSETKLRVALKVIGWLAGVVTTVMGAVVGGLFVFARFLLPKLGKLASLAHDTAPLVG